jgi:flagellin
MPLRINNNALAVNSQRHLRLTNVDVTKRIERLASGIRVNRAADDAAGLSISEGIRGLLSGLTQSIRNAEQATNLVQTAEGSLNEVNGMLVRMRELAVQSASSTVTDANRQSLHAEFGQLINEIDRIATATSYNNTTLLTGFGNAVSQSTTASTALDSATTGVTATQISGAAAGAYTFIDTSAADNEVTLGNGTVTQTISLSSILDSGAVPTGTTALASFDRLGIQFTLDDTFQDGGLDGLTLLIETGTGGDFQVGAKDSHSDRLTASIGDLRATGTLLSLSSVSISTVSSAQDAIASIDSAITAVTSQRGNLGAIQNRLGFTARVNEQALENNQATESSIRDSDVAEEVSQFTRGQILSQSGLAIFAQANILSARAISLLP